ncbi:putative signal peptide protein [Puccinia sorghi]|uniref:Putative signal peptide protein n=1 Tax=Puccinia sorghi TaxID=27349 RepID=A0A0L6UMB5_9BASI|nr:putative signal peptide protein [Puccinia sorghi]
MIIQCHTSILIIFSSCSLHIFSNQCSSNCWVGCYGASIICTRYLPPINANNLHLSLSDTCIFQVLQSALAREGLLIMVIIFFNILIYVHQNNTGHPPNSFMISEFMKACATKFSIFPKSNMKPPFKWKTIYLKLFKIFKMMWRYNGIKFFKTEDYNRNGIINFLNEIWNWVLFIIIWRAFKITHNIIVRLLYTELGNILASGIMLFQSYLWHEIFHKSVAKITTDFKTKKCQYFLPNTGFITHPNNSPQLNHAYKKTKLIFLEENQTDSATPFHDSSHQPLDLSEIHPSFKIFCLLQVKVFIFITTPTHLTNRDSKSNNVAFDQLPPSLNSWQLQTTSGCLQAACLPSPLPWFPSINTGSQEC